LYSGKKKTDFFHRDLAEVITSSGVNVNEKLLEEGLVALYPYQSGCGSFKSIQSEAIRRKLGFWGDKSMELPWIYRKRIKEERKQNKKKEYF
jgi:endonuclease YncB( thermonuclease family)